MNTTCLLDPDQARKTISLQMCGNGIVEAGEDCDPGTGVVSNCCNADTCKFTNGAVCDPTGSSCCTQSCTFAPASQVCRPSRDPKCDTAEYCTGNSSTCPTDITAPNGEFSSAYAVFLMSSLLSDVHQQGQSCGDNKLACASGLCTSVSGMFLLSSPKVISISRIWCFFRAMSICWRLDEPLSSLSRSKRSVMSDLLSGSAKFQFMHSIDLIAYRRVSLWWAFQSGIGICHFNLVLRFRRYLYCWHMSGRECPGYCKGKNVVLLMPLLSYLSYLM